MYPGTPNIQERTLAMPVNSFEPLNNVSKNSIPYAMKP